MVVVDGAAEVPSADPASRLDRAAAQASRQQQAWAYWGRQQQEHGAVLRTCPLVRCCPAWGGYADQS